MSVLEPLSLLTTLLSLTLAGLSWARRSLRGAIELMGVMIAIAGWAFFVLLITLSLTLEQKTLFLALSFLGVVSVPPLLLLFAARVTIDPAWLRGRVRFLLWIMPLITVVLALTDAHHGWMLGPVTPSRTVPGYIYYPGGGWWWVHAAYSYLLVIAAGALLARAWWQHRGVYRLQLGFWLGAMTVPTVVNFAQLFSVGLISGIDLTPASLTLTGMIIYFGLSRRQLLVIKPVALEVAFASLPDGVMVLDADLNLMHFNAAATRQLTQTSKKAIGEPAQSILKAWPVLEEALSNVELSTPSTVLHALEDSEYEYQITPIQKRNGRPSGFLLLARDVTEVRRYQRHVQDLAYLDSLTGLSNRRALFRVGQERLQQALERGKSSALLYIDLDRFKAVNDALGHEVGDTLLIRVADRLRAQVKADDLVSRNGGDEFAVLLESLSRENAELVAQRLEGALSRPYQLGPHEISIGASIGVAMFPDDASSIEDLLHQADLQMYQTKTKHRLEAIATKG